jgi:hypothetical protein
LAEQGVENPYDEFSGRLKHFMRARSELTEIGAKGLEGEQPRKWRKGA